MKKIFLLSLLCLALATAQSQDLSQLRTWQVSGLTDLSSGDSFEYTCSFQTHGTQNITWTQGGGSMTSVFTVTGRQGTWADVSQPGSVTYSVTLGEKSGTLTFERDAAGVRITLDLTATSGPRQQFQVTSIQ